MNNKEAFVLLKSSSSIRASSAEFVSNFQLPESEFHTIFRKFRELKSDRDTFLKRNDLATWESMLFFSCSIESPPKRRLYEDRTIFAAEISNDFRKPLSQLTNKGLKIRLASLLNLIETLALKEGVDSKTIASYGLQLVSCSQRDFTTASYCREIISEGSFGWASQRFPIDKSAFLLDQLQIGKSKYIVLRKLLKSENIIIPPYLDVSRYNCKLNKLQLLQLQAELQSYY